MTLNEDKPEEVKQGGAIYFNERADPEQTFKINTLTQVSFWEALKKAMKVKLMMVLIYMAAGGGIMLFALDTISVVFLKKHLFG